MSGYSDAIRILLLCNLQAAIQAPNFPGFCHEDELLTGDFDADKRSDLVCRKNGGYQYQIALSGHSQFYICKLKWFLLRGTIFIRSKQYSQY